MTTHAKNVIDFRSDTVTKPTLGMLEAMMKAAVGDDVYGEDPTVNELEAKVSKLLGFEAAMFVPSGTMANQIAIHLSTRPGDHIIAEEQSHVYLYETGASAALSGVQYDLIPFDEKFSNAAIETRFFPPTNAYGPITKLVTVENTHNRDAGRVTELSEVRRITSCAKNLGLRVHCDGARIWNAAAALKCTEKELAQGFDSVSVCFSKGLGAPVGSALCGSESFIKDARRIRKRWGGGMRQAGFLAAAASYALDHHRNRLVEDHRRLARFAMGLKETIGNRGQVIVPEKNTNILYLQFAPEKGQGIWQAFKDQGVLAHLLGPGKLRLLTHLHIEDHHIDEALKRIEMILPQVLR